MEYIVVVLIVYHSSLYLEDARRVGFEDCWEKVNGP